MYTHKILDHERDTRIDFQTCQIAHASAIESHLAGIHHAAQMIRAAEQEQIDSDPKNANSSYLMLDFQHFYPLVYCAFNWFAISLINYLRLVALVDLSNCRKWSLEDILQNSEITNDYCKQFAKQIAPNVHIWRDKVAAHPAASAPRAPKSKPMQADNLGTLLQSYSCPFFYAQGYLEVGRDRYSILCNTLQISNIAGSESARLLPYSVTAVHEKLADRFWPGFNLPPHRFNKKFDIPIDGIVGSHRWLVQHALTGTEEVKIHSKPPDNVDD